MAWPMHLKQRHRDHVVHRWERPPQVEEGQIALVHAPRAGVLLEHRAADADQPEDVVDQPV
ncbi:MAG: hypothetical protein M3P97_05465 [Actinomycetota bacterium]|jgi:hypothetical protein|nr:hypothetical protein [Actinomycetota bacterium]